jgi:hypothetical protein
MINYIKLNKNIVDNKTMKNLDTFNKDELKKIIKDINKISVDNFVEIIEDDGDNNIMPIVEVDDEKADDFDDRFMNIFDKLPL